MVSLPRPHPGGHSASTTSLSTEQWAHQHSAQGAEGFEGSGRLGCRTTQSSGDRPALDKPRCWAQGAASGRRCTGPREAVGYVSWPGPLGSPTWGRGLKQLGALIFLSFFSLPNREAVWEVVSSGLSALFLTLKAASPASQRFSTATDGICLHTKPGLKRASHEDEGKERGRAAFLGRRAGKRHSSLHILAGFPCIFLVKQVSLTKYKLPRGTVPLPKHCFERLHDIPSSGRAYSLSFLKTPMRLARAPRM